MKPRWHVRLLVAIGLIGGFLPFMTWTVKAAMSGASIDGLEGWSGGVVAISPSVDQSIDRSGHNAHTGTGAFRISNSTASGNHNGAFGGWVFGPGLSVAAGHPSSGAGADQFRATLYFRSASASADGSNVEIDLGSALGDDRNTFLALTNKPDAQDGLQLRAGEPDGATGNFRDTAVIATGIDRSTWHRLDMVATFVDGPANDTIEYKLDGAVVPNPAGGTTFGTFEGWRDGNGFAYALSNRVYFRSGARPTSYGGSDDTTAQGFYFDDLSYSVANHSAPGIPLDGYKTGFEPGMSAGSIQGIEGWSGGTIPIVGAVDQAIDQTGPNHHTGTGAFRISNNTRLGSHNGAFEGWVFGPGLSARAGEPHSGAEGDQFRATVWFRSASEVADGSYIEIDLGSAAGNDRNTNLSLRNTDTADGLLLRVNQFVEGDFHPVVIARRIARAEWHRLDIVANFRDGSANDTVEYTLDGQPLADPDTHGTTFGTYEGYFESVPAPYVLSNRLYFRSNFNPSDLGAFDNTAAQGFYFDDVSYSVARQSAPDSPLASYATGFEPPAPDLTVSTSHAGNFVRGQHGAQFTVTVTNSGNALTSGRVTLTDNVPAGFTPTAASGAGWSCNIVGQTVTCTRTNFLVPGSNYYPPVTITVNVARNAPASLANTATVSGGGEVNAVNDTATDVTTIGQSRMGPGSHGHDGDFDGDGKTDIAVYRPTTLEWPAGVAQWYIVNSATGSWAGQMEWGLKGDVPVAGDYDGDGKTDIAVYRPAKREWPDGQAEWYILQSSTGSWAGQIGWGLKGDVPVPGDYDGDGKTDIAVFRPAKGDWPDQAEWYILPSSTGSWVGLSQWGLKGDVPVPADYDGDGRTDLAVYRPSTGEWYIINSSTGSWAGHIGLGLAGDVPVPADYDGDGKADVAVFRPAKHEWPAGVAEWDILQSSTGSSTRHVEWGLKGDVPVPADYDGDGKTDIAVFRPAKGEWPDQAEWYILQSSTGSWPGLIQWGLKGDLPLPKR